MLRLAPALTLLLALLLPLAAPAADAGDDPFEPAHKVVIQVASADEAVQRTALNNVVNMRRAWGMDDVRIEVVAYGPGIDLVLEGRSGQAARVRSLAQTGVRFSACANTMDSLREQTGEEITPLPGVEVVASGVARVVELQERGYSYIRP